MSLMMSSRVTMSEPNAMEPNESVDARPNEDRVGWRGYMHNQNIWREEGPG